MGRLSFKERQKQQRELEIIQAAGQWISEHSYPDLNMDAIAEAVGISKPTLYQHFRSKDELVAKVMISAMEELERHLQNAASESPKSQLEHVYRMILTEKYLPGSILAGIETVQIIAAIHTRPDIAETKARVGAHLRRLIEEGKKQGEINQEMATELVMHYLFGTLHILDAAYPDKNAPKWLDQRQSLIDQMVKAFLRAITP